VFADFGSDRIFTLSVAGGVAVNPTDRTGQIVGDARSLVVDFMTGGAGDDTFVFALGAGHDVITDFVAGGAEDELSLRL
jgi:hypothetical protein